jgi:hypothetical protein
MSSVEQEPILVTNVSLPFADLPFIVMTLNVPGTRSDLSVSQAGLARYPQYRVVRVRGSIWITGTPSYLALTLQQGTSIGQGGGAVVLNSLLQPAVAQAMTPLTFEFVDTAPVGSNYILYANSFTAPTTVTCIANCTGFPA